MVLQNCSLIDAHLDVKNVNQSCFSYSNWEKDLDTHSKHKNTVDFLFLSYQVSHDHK